MDFGGVVSMVVRGVFGGKLSTNSVFLKNGESLVFVGFVN